MEKKILISISVIAVVGMLVYTIVSKFTKSQDNNQNIKIVISLEDQVSDNTAWCGTFNLIWND